MPAAAPRQRRSRCSRRRREPPERTARSEARVVSDHPKGRHPVFRHPKGRHLVFPAERATSRRRSRRRPFNIYIYYVYICLSLKIVGGGPFFSSSDPKLRQMVVQGDHIQATKTIFVKKKIFPSILAIFCPVLGRFGSFWVVLGRGVSQGSKNEHKTRKKIAADPMTAFPGR